MRKEMLAAKEAAGHAVWQSGTIGIDFANGYVMKVHEKYPEAPLSPIYISLRPDGVKSGKLLPEHLEKMGYAMSLMAIQQGGLFKHGTHTWIAGIPAAGEPILNAIRATIGPRRQKRLLEFKLEKVEDDHGRRIAGIHPDYQGTVPCEEGDSLTLVDDLMTNLATKQEAIEAIHRHGASVGTLLLFLDRSINGRVMLQSQGVRALSVWTFDQLMEFGLANQYLDRKTYEAIIGYPTELEKYIQAQAA